MRTARPDAFIIYKPHPDVVSKARVGVFAENTLYDLKVTDIAMPALLEQVDEVHTMTSLTGFEALVRGVPVTTYGLPFYAGWGLTNDKITCGRRGRQRNINELIALVLLRYAVYADPQTGDHINAETALDLLAANRDAPPKLPLRSRVWRLVRKTV